MVPWWAWSYFIALHRPDQTDERWTMDNASDSQCSGTSVTLRHLHMIQNMCFCMFLLYFKGRLQLHVRLSLLDHGAVILQISDHLAVQQLEMLPMKATMPHLQHQRASGSSWSRNQNLVKTYGEHRMSCENSSKYKFIFAMWEKKTQSICSSHSNVKTPYENTSPLNICRCKQTLSSHLAIKFGTQLRRVIDGGQHDCPDTLQAHAQTQGFLWAQNAHDGGTHRNQKGSIRLRHDLRQVPGSQLRRGRSQVAKLPSTSEA